MHKIINEVHRTGVSMDKAAIHGSIAAMLKAGLVYEVSHHEYQRTEVRPRKEYKARASKDVTTETKETTAMQDAMNRATLTVAVKPEEKKSVMDRLAQVAADLRAQAKDLEAEADHLDEVALQIAEEQQAGSKELEKIQRMRQAMKTLMGNEE
ncbi:MAG TPA: hypothetical protein VM783_17600 [Candidatus Acidoferrum sp.]|nr:hypothetical protein [Candidatus Acidoferrum sp.]